MYILPIFSKDTTNKNTTGTYHGYLGDGNFGSRRTAYHGDNCPVPASLCVRVPENNGYGNENLDNSHYRGEWIDGKRSGYGKYYKDGNLIYSGDWSLDKYDGHGTFYYNNGKDVKFTGVFSSGYPCEGYLFDKTGNIVFEGSFDDYYAFDLEVYDGENDFNINQVNVDEYEDRYEYEFEDDF